LFIKNLFKTHLFHAKFKAIIASCRAKVKAIIGQKPAKVKAIIDMKPAKIKAEKVAHEIFL